MKKIMIALVAIVALAGVAQVLFPSVTSKEDLTTILGSDILNQPADDYLVYFYQDDCYYCQLLEPTVVQAENNGVNVYKVDMADETNKGLWYDWEAHHATYDVVLGDVVDGERVLYDGVSEADYTSSEWQIVEEEGKVIAVNNTPIFNQQPTSVEEVEIAGTPVLLHVKDGEIVRMTAGYNESETYLKSFLGPLQ